VIRLNRRLMPYLLLTLLLMAGLVVTLEAPAILRIPVMLVFLLIAPGMAFVPLLRLEPAQEWTLAVALSLLLEALTATVLAGIQLWSFELNLELLASLLAVGCGLQIVWPAAETPEFLGPETEPGWPEHGRDAS
jgi:hypothetical protein